MKALDTRERASATASEDTPAAAKEKRPGESCLLSWAGAESVTAVNGVLHELTEMDPLRALEADPMRTMLAWIRGIESRGNSPRDCLAFLTAAGVIKPTRVGRPPRHGRSSIKVRIGSD